MAKKAAAVATAFVAFNLLSGPVHGSERADLSPGEANWHRYSFTAVTPGQIAVRQNITVAWDNESAGVLVALFNRTDPANPTVQAISLGDDRLVVIDVSILAGSYEIVVGGVVASTHYHLTVSYGGREPLTRLSDGRPTSATVTPASYMADLELETALAPHLQRLGRLVAQRSGR
jgi:hypothetical protein